MPTPEPPQNYTTHLYTIIGSLLSVLLGLVTYIANSFKKTQEGQQDELDAGVKEFTELKIKCEHLESMITHRNRDCDSMRKWITAIETGLAKAEAEIAELHDFKIKVELHHYKQHQEKI